MKKTLIFLIPITILICIGAYVWSGKHQAKIKLHPVDTLTFDTLHSRIPDIKTGD